MVKKYYDKLIKEEKLNLEEKNTEGDKQKLSRNDEECNFCSSLPPIQKVLFNESDRPQPV